MDSLRSPRSAGAVALMFAANGLAVGVWAASLASITKSFQLSTLQLSGLLIVTGLAAILSMQIVGRVSDRIGARRLVLITLPLLAVGIAGVGLAPSVGWLFASAVVFGMGNGGIDVAMNATGVQVEQRRPKPIMSFFHGMWSVGSLIGASLVVVLAPLFDNQPAPTVTGAALTAAVVTAAAWVVLLLIAPETTVVSHSTADGTRTPIPAAAYLLGIMAIASGLGEGTALDWSGLHVTEVAGVDPTTGSLGVTAVAALMVVIRLMGDFLVVRFGRRAVTRFGGACSALGYLTVAVATPLPILLIGWALVGFGIGMIAPQVYAVAGHSAGGRGLAVVVTFGYSTSLIAPALIGYLVSHFGIQHAMFVPAILLTGLLLIARIMPGREPAASTDPAVAVR